MSHMNQHRDILHDSYGSYTPSSPLPPVPPFPCVINSSCTTDNRVCERHKYVIFVKNINGETFENPYGKWENWVWYKQRISDLTGIPENESEIVYAEAKRDGLIRHSGLCSQSTIHMLQCPPLHRLTTNEKI
ncbi:unnamed protein product [Rotaria sp. Silwood2]|nr:unnamed protein product [Rotaria sp. Silwood2]CAF4266724.1 unnamed protein product [Rotaria sp. Silwood2]